MRIDVITPVRPGRRSGNDVTAARWASRFTELGHRSELIPWAVMSGESPPPADDPSPDADVVVALHARRCAAAVTAAKSARPDRPVVVGLAGTDLYVDLPDDAHARRSLELADRVVVLQSAAIETLRSIDAAWATKAHVVHQSVDPPLPDRRRDTQWFTVAVLAHLRDVKDPLMAARAARSLPRSSRVRVVHAGAAHDEVWRARAVEESETNDRYQWRGELARAESLDLISTADVLACTSRREGGANVVTEAIAIGVPVIGTRIGGNTGLLGDDHPGLVEVGDDAALTRLLTHLESDPEALSELETRSTEHRWLTDPANERSEWSRALTALDR